MALEPFQERVIAERNELAEKTFKLHTFLHRHPPHKIPEMERHRLWQQYSAMMVYQHCLEERIRAFSATDPRGY